LEASIPSLEQPSPTTKEKSEKSVKGDKGDKVDKSDKDVKERQQYRDGKHAEENARLKQEQLDAKRANKS